MFLNSKFFSFRISKLLALKVFYNIKYYLLNFHYEIDLIVASDFKQDAKAKLEFEKSIEFNLYMKKFTQCELNSQNTIFVSIDYK